MCLHKKILEGYKKNLKSSCLGDTGLGMRLSSANLSMLF